MVVVFAAAGVNAAGPLFMFDAANRIPYRYDTSVPVRVYTDNGPFEIIPPQFTPITNEKADEIVAFGFKQWTDVETSSFQAQVVGDFASIGLPDVNSAATAGLVIGPDNGGGIHVIYDADASIMRNFFGAPPSVLGIASPEWADETTGILTESWAIINAQPRWVGDDNLLNYAGVFTHEFGHSINLAHSQTTGAVAFFGNARGPANCTTLPYPTTVTVNDIETMYPFINPRPGTGSGLAQSTVDRTDDRSSVSDIYPAPGYPNTHGSITGKILLTDGKEGITGLNVIARNLDNPFGDAVSAMSGDYVRVEAGNDGSFTLSGLTPGARYALYSDAIVSGGFPTRQPFHVPGPEEFYNGAAESGNGLTDDRCQAEPITAVAGVATEADITLNSVKGAPKFIPLAPGTFPQSISSDGKVIGGNVGNGPVFRFTETDGYEVLSEGPSGNGKMSRDGNFFSGDTAGPAPGGRLASVLPYGGSWLQLPVAVPILPAVAQPCGETTAAYGVSSGGKAATGYVWVDGNGPAPGQGCQVRPFIWTPEAGSQILPTPSGIRSSRPNNISDDGSTVVGWYDSPTSSFRRGAIWQNGNLVELSTPTLAVGEAYNAIPNGSVVVGGDAGTSREPWRWTSTGGIQTLGRVAPNGTAGALAISDDGQIIAGLGGSSSFFPGDVSGRKAFLWTSDLGMVNFEDFLRAQGTFFEGWILNTSTAMSADGRTLVGVGFGPRAQGGWLVKLDKVNICHAPPGNPANAKTINVEFPFGMQAHLNHGDTIGVCVDSSGE